MVAIVLMGVCGCGKTSVGEALAQKLGWPFRDADDFHSRTNKRKMSSAVPLTDEDRLPWLLAIHEFIQSSQERSQSIVVTCSALKRCYRDVLRSGQPLTSLTSQNPEQPNIANAHSSGVPSTSSDVWFVLLKGSRQVLEARLAGRKGHFMPPDLLASQLSILEEPGKEENRCLTVDVDANDVSQIVEGIVDKIPTLRASFP